MPVAYVVEPGVTIHVEGGSLRVRKDGEPLANWELVHLDALCLLGGVHITQPAMRAVVRAGIELALLTADGRMLGRLSPLNARNAALRLAQYRVHEDPGRRLELARSLVQAKIRNARVLLLRFARNHPKADLGSAPAELEQAIRRAQMADSIPSLRGTEGNAARVYFGLFGRMCRPPFRFAGRSTRPPRDPVNALLSLAYTFLVNELTSITGAVGFDPGIGFYHEVASGRSALALDLAEPLRTGLMDRFVLYLVNNRVFAPSDFEQRDGGYRLTRPGLQAFIRQYQRFLLRKRLDAESGRKETLRRHLQLAAERFARVLTDRAAPRWFEAGG